MAERHPCKDCKHFSLSTFEEGCKDSWCTRYPPVYVGPDVRLTPEGCVNSTAYWEHPTVAILATCGEWEPRDDEPTDDRPFTLSSTRITHVDERNCICTDKGHYAEEYRISTYRCGECGETFERVDGMSVFMQCYCPCCGREIEDNVD